MSAIGYVAVKTFDRQKGIAWKKYIAWSGLHQLSRVVTTDTCLCPNVIGEKTPDDWEHVIQQDYMTDYFCDLEYLLGRVEDKDCVQILGLVRQPEGAFPHGFADSRFEFVGYDLVDKGTGVSALLSCGGFPESFSNSELNESGLIATFTRAQKIQVDLKLNNPGEAHADCDIQALWGFWRK